MAFGVYVHIPFCARRCDYCDFATWADRRDLEDAYVGACLTDLGRQAEAGRLPPADTVFFGGGTPSLLAAASLVRILDVIPRRDDAEVTLEANPESTDAAKLSTWRAHGVNRLSFGAQSFAPHVLDALGRCHDPRSVRRAVQLARDAGYERISLDVIYGTPGETVDDWCATLDAVIALAPEHVSAYALTVEAGTPLGARVRAGAVAPPDDDDQATKYEIADDRLGAAGYEWYEISNWARPGGACRHNLGYWLGGEWTAVGCAAHARTGGRRWWNVRTPERYVERVERGESPEAGGEELDAARAAEEALFLGLRTAHGAQVPPGARAEADGLAAAGLLRLVGDRAVLTRRGRLLATDVSARLDLAAGAGAGTR